jgi:serine/threonine-protein kinase 11
VSYLHSQGIVHQDIKPANILLSSDGGVYLSDFGVGHSFESADMVVGSPGYQAPEALRDTDWGDVKELNPAAEDVWSLGVTLYQCLFNRLPYEGNNIFEIVQKIMHSDLVIPETPDADVGVLLKGMLNVNPLKRMTLEQAVNSPYFEEIGDDRRSLKNVSDPAARIDLLARRKMVRATVCDVNYSFARPDLTAPFWSSFRVVSPPFPRESLAMMDYCKRPPVSWHCPLA